MFSVEEFIPVEVVEVAAHVERLHAVAPLGRPVRGGRDGLH